MRQASRIAIIGLLALMQLFAPLVHAHTGGGQFPGAIHVPGLEFFGLSHGISAQAPEGCGESKGVIIVLAQGLKNPGNFAIPTPDTAPALPSAFTVVIGSPEGHPAFSQACGFSPPPIVWLKPSPRAPPRLG